MKVLFLISLFGWLLLGGFAAYTYKELRWKERLYAVKCREMETMRSWMNDEEKARLAGQVRPSSPLFADWLQDK